MNDLKHELDNAEVYTPEQVKELVALLLRGAPRDKLDPTLARCRDVAAVAFIERNAAELLPTLPVW